MQAGEQCSKLSTITCKRGAVLLIRTMSPNSEPNVCILLDAKVVMYEILYKVVMYEILYKGVNKKIP